MSARLRHYGLLWRAAVTIIRPNANAVLGWGIGSITVLVTAILLLLDRTQGALVWAWCAPLTLLLLAWSFQFAPGAARLNTPANAQLVPAMRRHLAELAFAVWFLCLAGLAACPFASQATMTAIVLWLGIFSLGGALAAAGIGAGTALIFSVVILPPSVGILPSWLQALAARPVFLAAELVLLALAGALAMTAMFPRAGERHWRMLARRERQVAIRPADRPGAGPVRRTAMRCYAALLQRDCARPEARSLLAHVFGLGPGRAEAALGMLGMFAVGLAVIGLVRLHGSPGVRQASAEIGWIIASAILFLPMAHADVTLKTMPAMAAEQSLVRLAPLFPETAPAFNRLLGRALLRQALGGWALAVLAAFTLSWLSGASGATLAMQACASCLALPMLMVPLRDLSRRRSLRTVLSVLLPAGSVVLCLGAGMALRKLAGLPVMPVAAALALTLAAALQLRGWRSLVQAPFAFPAGRID